MLTQNEQKWLEERVLLPYYSCKYCSGYYNQSCNAFEPLSSCWNRLCENFDFEYFDKEVFLDATEFSERVAVKLALGCESQTPCNGDWRAQWKQCNLRKGYWDCADCFLKTARLIIEEKLDGEV